MTDPIKTPQEIAADIWRDRIGPELPIQKWISDAIAAAVQAERDRAEEERKQLILECNNRASQLTLVTKWLGEANETVKRLRKALMDEICPEGGCNHQDCLDCWKFLRDTDPEAQTVTNEQIAAREFPR